MIRPRGLRRSLAVLLVAGLLPGLLWAPGVVGASGPHGVVGGPPAGTTSLGTTVVVPAGETTTGSVTASGVRVVVAGRHEGNLVLYGGTVLLAGTVTGNVQAFGAEVRVTGTVDGSVVAYGGTVELADTGRVGNLLNAGGSRVQLNGTTNGSVQATGGRLVLGESASVARELTYDATLVDRGGTVAGDVSRTDRFLGPVGSVLRGLRVFPVIGPLFGLAAGLAGRRWLSRTTTDVTDSLAGDPLRSLAAGVGVLLASGGLAALLVVSLVGVPLVVVLVSLGALGALVGLGVSQSAVGRVVVGRVADSPDESVLSPVVGAGVGLLVGTLALVTSGVLPLVGLGLLAVASVAGVGTIARRARERDQFQPLASRFG